MVPLVVRPAAQAALLVQLLRQQGHAPLCCPLLETRPGSELPRLPEWLPQTDIVIAVSAHAVKFAHHFLLQTGLTWPHIDYFAVGQASADAFSEVGIEASCPDDPRSEGLLALPALQQVSGKRVLILRGNDGRDLIARTLASRGALVHYCATYERHYPELDGDALTRHWQTACSSPVVNSCSGCWHWCPARSDPGFMTACWWCPVPGWPRWPRELVLPVS